MLYLTYGTIVYLVLLMKAYAISAILKIFAFEISLGRKIDMLPEVNGNKTFFLQCDFISPYLFIAALVCLEPRKFIIWVHSSLLLCSLL